MMQNHGHDPVKFNDIKVRCNEGSIIIMKT